MKLLILCKSRDQLLTLGKIVELDDEGMVVRREAFSVVKLRLK